MQDVPPHRDPTPPEALQARLAAIVVSSDDGIISKTLAGIVESWNAAAERIFGYTADEMIGQPITRLMPPERLGEEVGILAKLQRGERVDHFPTVRVRKDGRRVFVSVSISPIADHNGRIIGASKIVRDITRATELEAMYEAIVTSADDAIISKDLDGIIRSWNRGAEAIFGHTADEMIGRPIHTLLPPDRLAEEADILARIRRGERVDHFQTVRMHKSGRLVDVAVTISPIRGPTGDVIGASKIARDVTWRNQLIREREALLASEQAARREAERVNRMKDEFLATLSHELRTPLNAILGWSQLLRGSPGMGPGELERGLETIERNARTQAKLIEDLLDVGRIVSGKMQLEIEWIDLGAIVSERVESLRPAADAKKLRVSRRIEPGVGSMLGDARRIQQVVWNLLANAIRYTPAGGSIDVRLRRIGSELELSVADTGVGIEPEFLPVLFTRFSQADSSSTRAHGGLGLGLAIVRHLVELHGGTVSASSPGPGLGSTFVVLLPLGASLASTDALGDAAPLATFVRPAVSLAGVAVLVVDDDDDGQRYVAHLLEGAGATVSTASSAAEAILALERASFDVLVSDIAMPDSDGYALIRRARSDGRTMPAIALTAFARPADRERALAEGFQLHMTKPFDAGELLVAVARLAGRTG